jgi:hypothetical protein
MKKTATTIAIAILGVTALASCTREVVREVPVTDPTEQTLPGGNDDIVLTPGEAIANARDSVPSLWAYTDAEMYEMMTVACDSIDQWAPDYYGFLDNMNATLAGAGTKNTNEITGIISAAIVSVCTYHQSGMIKALNAFN